MDSLSIKNYKNLKDIQINNLVTVNLIAGENNTGKSSLLEKNSSIESFYSYISRLAGRTWLFYGKCDS